MGYLHINNLYKDTTVLDFTEVYVLEKIHGTSAHVSWNEGRLGFFAGGCNRETFESCFDKAALQAAFKALGQDKVIVYGEAYGGKLQGMSKTYGPKVMFVAFDVKIGDTWLNVENAWDVACKLGIEFVWFATCLSDVATLNAYRDQKSVQAARNGMGEQLSEGIVIRPKYEFTNARGERVIAKHKGEAFSERASTPRDIDPTRLKVLEDAKAIALEWVTPMRLNHVLDKCPDREIRTVINAMTEDVYREAKGEIVESKAVAHAIKTRCAQLYRKQLMNENVA